MKEIKKSDFIAHGLYYIINGNEATVTGSVLDDVNGYACMVHGTPKCDIIIPKFVTFKGEKYYVTMIGERAFSGCSGIVSVTIPPTVTKIGRSAFFGCSGLREIDIPSSVTEIGEYAFYGCKYLNQKTA